jgi:ABC-type uncharacterized transport system auxiliary subunit
MRAGQRINVFNIDVFKIYAVGLLVAMVLLNGCVSQETVPQDYFYRLPDMRPSAPHGAKLFNGVLLVGELQAEGVYRERPILYVNSKRPLEVVQYHYRHWMQTPSQLIQDGLVEYLRRANIATKVERYTGDSNGDMLIRGRLRKFEQLVQPNGAAAVVAIEVEFRQKTSHGENRQTRVYEKKVMAEGPTIHDSVVAFGKAVGNIYDKMLADLNAMALEQENRR